MPRPSVAPQIAAQIIEYIREHQLAAGDRLPAHRAAKSLLVLRRLAGEPLRAAPIQGLHLGSLQAGHVALHGVADLRLRIRQVPIAFGKAGKRRPVEHRHGALRHRVHPVLFVDRLAQDDAQRPSRFSTKS